MAELKKDIQYALRMLASQPGFTAVAVITLALGIGANTAVFSVVHEVLLRPLAYRDSESLVTIWESNLTRGITKTQCSPVTYVDWTKQQQIFEGVTGWWYPENNLTGAGGDPERVKAINATDNFFNVLGVSPILGRGFLPGEDKQGAPGVAVIGHRVWQRRFAGDPQILGKPVTLDGRDYTIVGVAPPGFSFPRETEVWLPLGWNPSDHYRGARFFEVVARLRPGVRIEQARAEIDTLASRIAAESPQTNKDWSAQLILMREELVGDFRPALMVLVGSVAFVLLIACANVANLLLARAGARRKEVAIRMALGAARGRLIRQLLTESLLLALLGGTVGILLAHYGGNLLVTLNPVDVPGLEQVKVDGRILGFALGLSLLTGIFFGLVPALQASRADFNHTLREGGRDSGVGGAGGRLRQILVGAELGIALLLLVGAGLMLRSFVELTELDPGVKADNILTFNLQLPGSQYSDWQKVTDYYSRLEENLARLPGVSSVATAGFFPLETGWRVPIQVTGRPAAPRGEEPQAQYRPVGEAYFRTLGIPLQQGRFFTERDKSDAPGVVIINQALALRHFSEEEPIGRRIRIFGRGFGPLGRVIPQDQDFEVVGVVGDESNSSLGLDAEPAIYFSQRQLAYRSMNVALRAESEPMAMLNAVRREVWALDRNIPVSSVRTMDEVLGDAVARPRFSLVLLGVFAVTALLLAGVGVYGVMSYSVAQRSHEIGVRMALGAQTRDVFRLVVGQGMLVAAIGLGAGWMAALFLSRVMASLLFGVSVRDPITFGLVPLVLALVALLACLLPALRATRVDPLIALRVE